MSLKELSQKLHSLERTVLPKLKKNIGFQELVSTVDLKEIEVMRAIQWMENKSIVKIDSIEKEVIDLDKNGILYKKKGLSEKQFLELIKNESKKISEMSKKLDKNEINICIGLLKKNNAIVVKKDRELIFSITSKGIDFLNKKSTEEKFLELNFPISFEELEKNMKNTLSELLKRKQFIKKDMFRHKKSPHKEGFFT